MHGNFRLGNPMIDKLQVADPRQLTDRSGNEPVHHQQERAST